MWASLIEIIATLIRWLKGSTEAGADTRVRQLEDASSKARATELEAFDAEATAVRDADAAIELLKRSAGHDDPEAN